MCLYQLGRNILLSEALFDAQIVHIKDTESYVLSRIVNRYVQWSASNGADSRLGVNRRICLHVQ